ncbi:hypothetical protein GO755_11450 [Spirosoma sp. HMF4905]|uniref:Lipoprotein n=1 Tax=Spirosoma arboris TaxID=2682092 RepID=A0A7K1SA10_9BACT|nr:hypothetical protein [Spirosoma arboris]MVM30647.1 hypothetical protein [Spirosoma arboris]
MLKVKLTQNKFNVSAICILLLLYACKQVTISTQYDGDYAHAETGRFWIYEVQEEQYSLSDSSISSTYFFKETIGELLSTTQGSKTYKLTRYKKSRLSDNWRADSIWTMQQWPDKLIRTENNIAYVKLIFPVATTISWNQNEYNALPATLYQYTKVGKPYKIGTINYSNTAQVTDKKNDSTAISLHRQLAIYAYQTGLIFKETTDLAYCQSSSNCIGKGQIAYGYRQQWTLIESGKE